MSDVDQFLSAPESKPKEFDRWGRYLLPDPQTGKMGSWQRSTTFAKALSDDFALSQWAQRMALKGASMRPDLVSLASTLDVKADRSELNKLVEQAKDAAGQKDKANQGTAHHSMTEIVDRGGSLADIHPASRTDISAYADELVRRKLTPIPHLIERKTLVRGLGVAGRFDRIYREADGQFVIGDLKTGNIEYDRSKIEVQLAVYAHGVNGAGVYDQENEKWDAAPEVRTDYGIIMHLPVGSGTCTAYKVDLARGWETAQLCAQVHAHRKGVRNIKVERYEAGPHAPSWEERFAAVTSRAQASALYREALRELGEGPELSRLVQICLKMLG